MLVLKACLLSFILSQQQTKRISGTYLCTLEWKLQIKVAISHSHNVLTPCFAVLSSPHNAGMSVRVDTRMPVSHWYDLFGLLIPGSPSLLADTFSWTAGMTFFFFVGCLTSQQPASVSQGRICMDNFTCCHTEIEVADQTFHLTQSQYTDTGPTSPSADPITPGAWQGIHWSANV